MASKAFVNIPCPKCGKVVSGIYCPMCGKKLENGNVALYRQTSRKWMKWARELEGDWITTALGTHCFEIVRWIQRRKYKKGRYDIVRFDEIFSQKDADEIESNLMRLFTWVKAFADEELQKAQETKAASQW